MYDNNSKIVAIIDETLPVGLALNAMAVIGVSMGRLVEGLVGDDVPCQDGVTFPGVIKIPLPLLKADAARLSELFQVVTGDDRFMSFPFSKLAQSCRSYDEYISRMSAAPSATLALSGLGFIGPKAEVVSLTGSLPLYR